MNKDEALRLALEALEWANKEINNWMDDAYGLEPEEHPEIMQAITAIKAALETKEESWEKFCDSHCVWTDHHPDCRLAKDEPVSQPKVRTGNCLRVGVCASEGHKIQPQRIWVGLTDEEMKAVCAQTWSYDPYLIARAIEAKLKEKNT